MVKAGEKYMIRQILPRDISPRIKRTPYAINHFRDQDVMTRSVNASANR